MPRDDAVCHALVTPWPISSGLHTWCGCSLSAQQMPHDRIAGAPELVNCPKCIRAMKAALTTLHAWVPRLVLPAHVAFVCEEHRQAPWVDRDLGEYAVEPWEDHEEET